MTSSLWAQPSSPPTISFIQAQTVYPNTTSPPIGFIIGDAETSAANLLLTAFSLNTNLVPLTNIVFGGSGSNRTATVVPASGQRGTNLVSITVTDGDGLMASNSFMLDVSYFTDVTPVFSGSILFNPRWADYDNDGELDLYLGGSVYRNDRNLTFTRVASLPLGARNGVAWGDYDRDGDLDIAIASGATSIYRNDGNGVFTDIGANLRGVPVAAVAWGDYDNDGRVDLLMAGGDDHGYVLTDLYHNNGNNTFALVPNAGFIPMEWAALAWGDVDNDGWLDVLINGEVNGGPLAWATDVYHNNGDGTFTKLNAGLSGVREGSVSIGDFDNDGRLDLLTTGFSSGNYVLYVYHNDGSNSFSDININLKGEAYGDAHWADFDNDGFLDIFVDGCIVNYCDASIAAIYRNNRDGTFSDANVGLTIPASTSYPVSWGDFDNDGDLDLFFYGLLRNNSNVSNSPPTAPTSLLAHLLPDNNVQLQWSPASDAQNTNAAGLSYAVRVGLTPGGLDYVSPNAHGTNGFRRVPQRGPMNTNACLLRDLPPGTYYWSVQAIDAGFTGSPFALESSFTITNTRAVISPITTQFTVPNRSTPPISFTVSDFETPAGELTLSGISSNSALLPNENIVFGGSGSNRTVTLTPVGGRSGTVSLGVVVADAAQLTATSRFDLVVETFTDAGASLPRSDTGASAWADYDNDGDLDVALAGAGVSHTTIFRNSSGAFSNAVSNLPNRVANDFAWVDYDNDGDMDLTECGWENTFGYFPMVYVFRNNGMNTFTSLTDPGLVNIADGSIAWGDFDNDGDADVLLTGDLNTYHVADGASCLYRNDRGVFTNTGLVLPGVARSAAAWADFDKDGDLDILLAGQTGPQADSAVTKLFRNDGNGIFTEAPAGFPGITQCAVAWGDYDNDGDLDVLLAGVGTNSTPLARIYRNNSNGTFTDSGAVLTGVAQCAVAWGDYDNDGFLDVLVTGTTNGLMPSSGAITRIYHNDGGTNFTDLGGTLFGLYSHSASWGDFDKDGDLDILLGSRVLKNNLNAPNTPPTAPTNLIATILPDADLRFSWSKSTDAQAFNSNGLSYNVRIGTTPGGVQILSPQADPMSGFRRLPQMGNAGQMSFWRASLTNGTYYWSVQAIDTAFAGSAFAAEGIFTLSSPIISAVTNRSTLPNTPVGPINFTVSDAETDASNIVVTVSSSDTNLVADTGLLLGGVGTNRTLTITPATNRIGVVTITITAMDEAGERARRSFSLTIERFVNISANLSAAVGPVAWGDFDNDGDLDLVRSSTIYQNNGDGTFTDIAAGIGVGEWTAIWEDYDNDGNLDLLLTGSNATRVYRSEGNGVFVNINAGLPTQTTSVSAAWGDFDNDGHPDIVLAGAAFTRVYRNNGDQTFTDILAGMPALPNGAVAWGDYDKDGDLDLLLAGNGLFRIYGNTGNGAFTSINLPFLGLYYTAVAWGDFDNDGDLDFAVMGSTYNSISGVVTRIYRNNNGAFMDLYPNAPLGPTAIWKGTVAWGDYDNDGDLDLLICGETTTFTALPRIYRNENGAFTDSGHALPGLKNSFAAWGDYDNDGNLDLALSGYDATGTAISRIYRNFQDGPANIPPCAPTGLGAEAIGKSGQLSWAAATDANQANGLTYNLRIGTSPGAGNIVSPMSDAAGFHRLPRLGNVNHRLSWTITNLTGVTYYWSVQAVDAAFAGSPFAEEHSFTIFNRPPVPTSASITMAEDTSQSLVLAGADPDGDPLTFRIACPPLFGQLTGPPPNFTYKPRTNYFGFDQFTFVANDRTTDSVPANVFITVTPVEDVSASRLCIEQVPGGQYRLSFFGEPWRSYRIEASGDLVRWMPLTNLLCTDLLTHFLDADALNFPQRFYRAALAVVVPGFGPTSPGGGNQVSFTAVGEVGRNYQIQASTNLITWMPLANVMMSNASMPFLAGDAPKFPRRFFRIVTP